MSKVRLLLITGWGESDEAILNETTMYSKQFQFNDGMLFGRLAEQFLWVLSK